MAVRRIISQNAIRETRTWSSAHNRFARNESFPNSHEPSQESSRWADSAHEVNTSTCLGGFDGQAPRLGRHLIAGVSRCYLDWCLGARPKRSRGSAETCRHFASHTIGNMLLAGRILGIAVLLASLKSSERARPPATTSANNKHPARKHTPVHHSVQYWPSASTAVHDGCFRARCRVGNH